VTALLAGVAVAVALAALRPAATTGTGLATVVAARLIPSGAVIGPGDVRVEARPAEHRPESATGEVTAVVGQRAGGPIEAKGVVTTERLAGPGLLSGRSDGRVAMTVPVMEVALTGIQPGADVDVYATGTGQQVVSDAQVLAVLGGTSRTGASGSTGDGTADATGGGLGATVSWEDQPDPGITVAVSSSEARLLAQHLSALGAGESFVLAVRPAR
jgi:Flp pilus assembly protein CpaB